MFHPYGVKMGVADLEHVVAYARMSPGSIMYECKLHTSTVNYLKKIIVKP